MWNRGFLTIAASNLVSRAGTVAYDVVLAWWLVQRTGATVVSGYVLAASTVPVAVLSPVSGVLVDRWNYKYLLVVTDAVSCAAALAVAGMASRNIVNVPALIVCSALLGASSSLFRPAIRSIVPALVPKDHLAKANSLTTGFASVTAIVGPVLGAALMAVPGVGVAGALLFNSVSFGLSALGQSTIAFRPDHRQAVAGRIRDSLRAGLAYLARHPVIRNLLLLCGAANFFLVSVTILLPLYVSQVLHQGSGAFSLAVSAEALGGVAVTVGILTRRSVTPKPAILACLVVASGICLAIIPLVPNLSALIFFSVIVGALMSVFNTLFFTYIQQVVATEFLGRIFSFIYMVAIGVMPISYLLFGSLGHAIIKYAFLYTGIGAAVVSLPFIRLRQHSEDGDLG